LARCVRYADTDGFHADNYRSVYLYRDYVINAFNTNLPFDRFTIEQLAGDLLPNATLMQKVASTYNRLNRTTRKAAHSRRNISPNMPPIASARLQRHGWVPHSLRRVPRHKFDPYTTKDFYSFEAFFADIKEVGVGHPEGIIIPSDKQAAELKKLTQAVTKGQAALDTQTPELDHALMEWENGFTNMEPPKLSEWHSVGRLFPVTLMRFQGPVRARERNCADQQGSRSDQYLSQGN